MDTEGWLALILAAIGLVAIFAIIGFFSNVTGRISCNAQFADFEHRYGFWEGCMVKAEGKWVPDENYRALKD